MSDKKCEWGKHRKLLKQERDGYEVNGSFNEVRQYNDYGESLDGKMNLPETMESAGNYCDACVNYEQEQWWELESQSYLFDNSGNQPGDPDFDPEDTFGVHWKD